MLTIPLLRLTAIFEQDPSSKKRRFICGGTLISSAHVVTAAHCIHSKNEIRKDHENIFILLGAHKLDDPFEIEKKFVRVQKIEISDDYSRMSERFTDDLALITLQEKITFTDYILPICIYESNGKKVFTNGIDAGWGKTSSSTNQHSDF